MTDAPLEAGPPQQWRAGLSRRRMLNVLAGVAIAGRPGQVLAAPGAVPAGAAALFPAEITAIVAGQEGGNTDAWARLILAALAQELPPGTNIRRQTVGAADGVTGANQFETRTAPDGASLLVVPGAASIAWLAGDPRAQFEVGHWVPVMAGVSPGIVALRGGRAGLVPGQKLRIATASLAGPELSAWLGVHLLGGQPVPVTGLMEEGAIRAALLNGSADGVLLRGRKVMEQVASMSALGVWPVFSLGALDENGALARDPQFPDLPEYSQLLTEMHPGAASGPLFDAWRAVAAAARLEFAVVLPQLTPAAMVALWRRAGSEAAAAPLLATATSGQMVRALCGAAGAAEVSAVAAESASLLELRRWLGAGLGWHPG